MSFTIFYNKKNSFLGYQNKKFKKSKYWHFSKGLVNPWFWSKNGLFFNFSFSNIGKENVFYDILERKNSLLGHKNTKFKKSKYWHFSKVVDPWFWSQKGHFSQVFFCQYRQGKCLLRYFTTKKLLSRL